MNNRAFTLVELLVTLAITGLLTTIGTLSFFKLQEKSKMAKEINAARGLMVSYNLYAMDNGGRVMPGYEMNAEAENLEGDFLYSPISDRYPWRIAPYIEQVKNTLVYNGNDKLLGEENSDYLVSVRPNLGLNATFVGGHQGSSSLLRPSPRMEERLGKWYISHVSEPSNPSNLIVFASSRSGNGDNSTVGYFEIQPPKALSNVWGEEQFDPEGEASAHGYVDLRWSGRAVAAMFDGSVELLDEEQLRDMRRWSNDAAEYDDPDYTITP